MPIAKKRPAAKRPRILMKAVALKRPKALQGKRPKVVVRPAPQPIDGNGIARGCRLPSSIKIGVPGLTKEVGAVLPSWVEATPSPRDHRAQGPKTVEGVLVESRITSTDFPLKPWHTYYDWNFFVRVDSKYRGLLSVANVKDHGGLMECEWDTAFLPSWVWPQSGRRIYLVGRWIYDCGHPTKNGYKTEIHPPKAVATFRSEPVKFPGNRGLSRANNAVLFISRNGGYFTSPINDQDYEFSFPLPPKPNPTSVPRFKVRRMTKTLAVRPIFMPFPASNPRQVKVRIPLKGVRPHPTDYGAILSAGWSDPQGVDAKKMVPVRVTVEKIFMDANKDRFGADEWYVYVGVNGRWKVFKSLGGKSKNLNFKVSLPLHSTDKIQVTTCGFEADSIHDLMGKSTNVSPATITKRSSMATAVKAAKAIRNKFLSLGDIPNENDKIGQISKVHSAGTRGVFTVKSDSKQYRLRYRIARG